MELETKLAWLTQAAIWEPAEETNPTGRAGAPLMDCIYEARAHGRPVRLLKVLLTSACERDCYYCPFRAGRSFRRATFQPDELARAFHAMHQRGLVDGLFLSSGIVGGGLTPAAAGAARPRGFSDRGGAPRPAGPVRVRVGGPARGRRGGRRSSG